MREQPNYISFSIGIDRQDVIRACCKIQRSKVQMVSRFTPLLISERNAALLFDMITPKFRALRNAGHLPKPRLSGEMAETGGMEW
jgi:hypothetical protein